MEKSADAFRTISEVAEDLDLPQHVLRFWETRFVQIKPLKRAGGRRFYRPDDVELLRAVRHLLYGEGYTIKGVQKILKEQGVQAVISVSRAARAAAEPGSSGTARVPAAKVAETQAETQEPKADLRPASRPAGRPAGAAVAEGGLELDVSQLPLFAKEARTSSRRELGADAVPTMEKLLAELLECQRILEVGRRG
ncbi:MAG: MerR family transcriptional regulator [Beijerinckiaceae bacterium]